MKQFFKDLWTNHKKEVISAIVLVFVLGLLLSQCGSSGNNATDLPGGGAVAFFIALFLTVGATLKNNKGLWALAVIFWGYWLYPKVMPILNLWGIFPSLAILLFAGMVWWIYKSRKIGWFGYRIIIATILLFSAFSMSTIMNAGIAEMKKVNLPSVPFLPAGTTGEITGAVGKKVVAIANKLNASADRDIVGARRSSQTQKTWGLPAEKPVYDNLGNGNFVPRTDLSYMETVRVFSLGESFTTDAGATYEKCGAPDPITGQPGKYVVWIFIGDIEEISPTTGHILSSDGGDREKEKKITPQKTGEGNSAPTQQHMSWEEYLSRQGVL